MEASVIRGVIKLIFFFSSITLCSFARGSIYSNTKIYWGDPQQLHNFFLGTQELYKKQSAIDALSGNIQHTAPHLSTALRSDGIIIEEDGFFYSTGSGTKMLPHRIRCIANTGGLYGFTYLNKTLTLYNLSSIEKPEEICSIRECPFQKNTPPSLMIFGDYFFIGMEKSLNINSYQKQAIPFAQIPETRVCMLEGTHYRIPWPAESLATTNQEFDAKTEDLLRIAIPITSGAKKFFLCIKKEPLLPSHYLFAQENGRIIGHIEQAAFSNPIFSLHENKLFFAQTPHFWQSGKPGEKKGTVWSFDGELVRREGAVYFNGIRPQLTFLAGKLTLYNQDTKRAVQFSPLTLDKNAPEDARVISLLKTIGTKNEGPTTEDSLKVHTLYLRIHRRGYIAHALQDFFDDPDLTSDTYISAAPIAFLNQVYKNQERIAQCSHPDLLKHALTEEFFARYRPYVRTISDQTARNVWWLQPIGTFLHCLHASHTWLGRKIDRIVKVHEFLRMRHIRSKDVWYHGCSLQLFLRKTV